MVFLQWPLSFAQLFALEFSTPIWVALLAPLFLNEVLTKQRIISVTLGFAGILIMLARFFWY